MDRSEKLKYGLSVMYTPFSQQYIEFGNTIRETKADRVREKKDIGTERQAKRHSQSNRWGKKKENKDTILYNQCPSRARQWTVDPAVSSSSCQNQLTHSSPWIPDSAVPVTKIDGATQALASNLEPAGLTVEFLPNPGRPNVLTVAHTRRPATRPGLQSPA
ncbi:hypothetical protein RRG08_045412 [Elysia crispata]|uniref:Uncharacterized protein n=1 Tax=Elysia crispata TaxID=231223 RepID=A0AAE0XMP9_9GAST|nr:hypothetical protein RRG08_045412 [Elysia crispata]